MQPKANKIRQLKRKYRVEKKHYLPSGFLWNEIYPRQQQHQINQGKRRANLLCNQTHFKIKASYFQTKSQFEVGTGLQT